VTKDNIL